MFEGIKIVTTFECVRGLVPKGWANIRQSILTVVSLSFLLDILIFENYFLIENYSLWQHQRLHSNS